MKVPKIQSRRTAFIVAPILYFVLLVLSYCLFNGAPVKQTDVLVAHIVLAVIGIVAFLVFFAAFIKILLSGVFSDSYSIIYFVLSSVVFLVCQLFMFGIIYKATGLVSPTRPLDNMAYFYFSTMTLATVGYGDIVPSEEARIVTVIQVLLGYLYLGLFIGLTTSMISQVNEDNR